MIVLAAGTVSILGACSAGGGSGDGTGEGTEAQAVLSASGLRIVSLSTRPYLVTGGDVLLRLELGTDLDPSQLEVLANGSDVTQLFRTADDGNGLVGLVQGLREGDNQIEARIAGGDASTQLQITNYPIQGPIISGPHETPFLCQTEAFTTAAGVPLGPPLDEDCSVETRVEYVYLSTLGGDSSPTVPTQPEGCRPTSPKRPPSMA